MRAGTIAVARYLRHVQPLVTTLEYTAEGVMPKKILQKILNEREVPHGRELVLEFREESGEGVSAVLQLPSGSSRAPAALLLHGFSSRKEVLADTVGRTLLRKGIVSLAFDLPLHGTRAGTSDFQASLRNPLEVMEHWRQALREARLGLHYLRARPEVRRDRLAIVGYSLGSQIGAATAAAEPDVRALVIAAGGDLPSSSPVTALARMFADPIAAVKALNGRPLLMIHGRSDRTVTPEQAKRLFDAASEPKEIRWFDAGHRLPTEAIEVAVNWLAEKLA
jgi:uncharacterized protein